MGKHNFFRPLKGVAIEKVYRMNQGELIKAARESQTIQGRVADGAQGGICAGLVSMWLRDLLLERKNPHFRLQKDYNTLGGDKDAAKAELRDKHLGIVKWAARYQAHAKFDIVGDQQLLMEVVEHGISKVKKKKLITGNKELRKEIRKEPGLRVFSGEILDKEEDTLESLAKYQFRRNSGYFVRFRLADMSDLTVGFPADRPPVGYHAVGIILYDDLTIRFYDPNAGEYLLASCKFGEFIDTYVKVYETVFKEQVRLEKMWKVSLV